MNNPFDVIDARLGNIENLLLDIKHKPLEQGTQPEPDRWLDINELCQYLPDKPAKPTVYQWVSEMKIPCHRGTKKLRFLKSEIDNWLMQGRRKTVQELQLEAKKKGLKHE